MQGEGSFIQPSQMSVTTEAWLQQKRRHRLLSERRDNAGCGNPMVASHSFSYTHGHGMSEHPDWMPRSSAPIPTPFPAVLAWAAMPACTHCGCASFSLSLSTILGWQPQCPGVARKQQRLEKKKHASYKLKTNHPFSWLLRENEIKYKVWVDS